MLAVGNETLQDVPVEFSEEAACCVMLASGGYPGAYDKGKVIDLGRAPEWAQVFHSGTARDAAGRLITAGGRVLGICCMANKPKRRLESAYRAADEVSFEGMCMRRDIGRRALAIEKGEKPMVYRVYVEKKIGFDHEASALYRELKSFLGIEALEGVRILTGYDVENIEAELFEKAIPNVFSEPM